MCKRSMFGILVISDIFVLQKQENESENTKNLRVFGALKGTPYLPPATYGLTLLVSGLGNFRSYLPSILDSPPDISGSVWYRVNYSRRNRISRKSSLMV